MVCAKKKEAPKIPAIQAPVYGGTFRVCQDVPQTLDPAFVDDVYESSIIHQIFDGLLRFDVNLNPVPALAESWTISKDKKTYIFKLKKGVKFHTGRELRTQDFVHSFTRIFDQEIRVPTIAQEHLKIIKGAQVYLQGRAEKIAGLWSKDDYELVIELEYPSITFLSVLAGDNAKVVPQEEVERMGGQGFGDHPVGTGPFRFVSWEPGEKIVLAAFNGYYGGRPYLDSLIFYVPVNYSDDKSASDFRKGLLDMTYIPIGEWKDFEKEKEYKIIKRVGMDLEYLGFNLATRPFDDPDFRRAIQFAINRKRLLSLGEDQFIEATGIFPPGIPGYTLSPKVLPFDPQKARALLNNKRYSIEYWTVTEDVELYENDYLLVEDLKAVGIDVVMKGTGWLEFDRGIMGKRVPMFSLGWVADIPDPDSFLFSLFHSHGSNNYFNYKNERVDNLLEEARREWDPQKRIGLYQQAEGIILEDCPIVPLDHTINTYALKSYVNGVEMSPFGMANLPMGKIWFSKDKID
ncbi:ABC transporter substrate-binding protein [candidate division KSB1 bacterium]|nr:ABC transporter substrate-binding protein [candidate division KSB1 bacterium]